MYCTALRRGVWTTLGASASNHSQVTHAAPHSVRLQTIKGVNPGPRGPGTLYRTSHPYQVFTIAQASLADFQRRNFPVMTTRFSSVFRDGMEITPWGEYTAGM